MERALGELGEELANKAGRSAVSAAARQLREELKRTAPVGPGKPKVRTSKGGTVTRTDLGHLKDNIRTKREKARKSDKIRYVVDRKSVVEGKSVSVRVDPGGRRYLKKKTHKKQKKT